MSNPRRKPHAYIQILIITGFLNYSAGNIFCLVLNRAQSPAIAIKDKTLI